MKTKQMVEWVDQQWQQCMDVCYEGANDVGWMSDIVSERQSEHVCQLLYP